MSAELLRVVEVRNTLGEGILWDSRAQRVCWTDIQECKFYSYVPETEKLTVVDTPKRLCSFAFTEDENWLIAAFDDGFAFYNPWTGEVEDVAKPFNGVKGLRFNDGRVGPDGRFWVGTMVENESEAAHSHSGIYALGANKQIEHYLSDIKIANAICWSENGETMYFADSPDSCILKYEFGNNANCLSNKSVFARLPEGFFPDGAVTDSANNVWNAQWGGSRVVCYAPDGRERDIIELPVTQPTCLAFGGKKDDLLFVTTAREGLDVDALDAQPNAGNMLIYKIKSQGLPNSYFCRG